VDWRKLSFSSTRFRRRPPEDISQTRQNTKEPIPASGVRGWAGGWFRWCRSAAGFIDQPRCSSGT